jgi:ribosomal protein S18 acetylase RimI-like enzyme
MGDERPETLRLRPAEPADASFQRALFDARRGGLLRLSGLPEPALAGLLEMQHRARGRSYREAFPDARWLIVERDGEAVGELILCAAPDGLHVVDVTLRPDRQRQGLGPALLRAVMAESAPHGGVRAFVAVDNAPSRKMFARLGFVERACGDGANVEVFWRAEV